MICCYNKGCDSVKELPVRKPNRLKDYDYSQNGRYFITICAKDQSELFSIVGAASCRPHNDGMATHNDSMVTHNTEIGNIIENEITILSSSYHGVSVDCFVIMPNHIHMIICINWADGGRQDAAPTISQMINQWKRAISIKVGRSVWQKSFHDHVIRNENEYIKIAEYIENNPIRWKEDCFTQDKYLHPNPDKPCRGGILPPA